VINVILYANYALGALTLLIGLPVLGMDFVGALFLASLVLFAALTIHLSVANRRRLSALTEEVSVLRNSHVELKGELGDAHRKIEEVSLALAKRTEAHEKKLVGEIQMIEGLVREFTANLAKSARTQPGGEAPRSLAAFDTPSSFTDPDMLEVIRRSLEENRVDLYLQPTVSLPQRKLRFYEAFTRLRAEDGRVIMPAQYMRVAAPAGLMSVVDNLLLFRCVQVVKRLTSKRRDLGVFCNISGHTLADAEFFPQFLDFMHHHRDVSGQIVFEFSEKTVLEAGELGQANLRYLSGLGFALSMDQVSDLRLDFARLKHLGFRFVKVPAETLISGMRGAHSDVAAEDLKDLLARNGLNLIVERIEDERTVVQLLDLNVDYGQGFLFGEPKPIREMADAHDPRTQLAPTNVALFPAKLARRMAG
jgi:cyclic-di-GMP phosphodiesterase TipF (flagellum assembly factor)